MNEKVTAIHQFLSGFTRGDAISDYALEIQKIVRNRGYNSDIYCEYLDSHYKGKSFRFPYYLDHRKKDDIVILHYSIGSSLVPFVYEEAKRIVLIYHNITPHHYFKQINPYLYKECLSGRRWLPLFKDKVELALADSEYNRRELEEMGFKDTQVLPITIDFNKFEKQYSFSLVKKYSDGRMNWLFIGRIIPNKKVEDVLHAFHAYHRYFNSSSRLFVVGNYKGYERYFYGLMKIIADEKIEDVVFTGHTPTSFLSALLKVSHVFVMLSEHEGFCVPLLEAMYRGIPVVAYESGAIPYTLKGSGVLIKEKNPVKIAALIHEILNNKALKDTIVERQHVVLQEYRSIDFEKLFFSCMEQVIKNAIGIINE